MHPSGREEVNRRFPWHLTTVLSQRIKPEPQRGPGLHGESGLGFPVSLGLKRPLFRARTRTHQSRTQWREKPGPARLQLEEREQAPKEIWQLEPLFLVLF